MFKKTSLYFLIISFCFVSLYGCGGSKDELQSALDKNKELEARLLKSAQEAEAQGKAKPPAVSVCDRTKEIQEIILSKVKKTDCKVVTDQELSSIHTFIIENPETPITLKANDFSGFTVLGVLVIEGLGNTDILPYQPAVLPADVFSGLASLEILILTGAVEALPAGLLSGLTSLEELRLNFWVDDVPVDLFSGLTKVRKIGLTSENYPEGLFSNLPSLEKLGVAFGYNLSEEEQKQARAEKQRIQAEVGEGVRVLLR